MGICVCIMAQSGLWDETRHDGQGHEQAGLHFTLARHYMQPVYCLQLCCLGNRQPVLSLVEERQVVCLSSRAEEMV